MMMSTSNLPGYNLYRSTTLSFFPPSSSTGGHLSHRVPEGLSSSSSSQDFKIVEIQDFWPYARNDLDPGDYWKAINFLTRELCWLIRFYQGSNTASSSSSSSSDHDGGEDSSWIDHFQYHRPHTAPQYEYHSLIDSIQFCWNNILNASEILLSLTLCRCLDQRWFEVWSEQSGITLDDTLWESPSFEEPPLPPGRLKEYRNNPSFVIEVIVSACDLVERLDWFNIEQLPNQVGYKHVLYRTHIMVELRRVLQYLKIAKFILKGKTREIETILQPVESMTMTTTMEESESEISEDEEDDDDDSDYLSS